MTKWFIALTTVAGFLIVAYFVLRIWAVDVTKAVIQLVSPSS
ncbi:MAG TPA: hypothetical protein VIH87_07245 [Methylocella sp.]